MQYHCIGSSTAMVVPLSELSSTQTEPPWRLAISHTRESPSPAPPYSRLRDLSTRKNDCKTEFHADAKTIAKGMEEVARKANKTAGEHAKIVIVSPIHLGKGVGEEGFDPEFNERSENVSKQLAWEYEKIAKENGFYYFDAAGVAKPSEVDRQHLYEAGHKIFAEKYSEFLLTEVL